MSTKKISKFLAIALVLGLTTVATAGWPGETLVSETTTNWSGSAHVWGGHSVVGAGVSTFDTDGAFLSGYYTGRTEIGNTTNPGILPPSGSVPLIASRIHATVTDGYISHDQTRTGPDPICYNLPAPAGMYSSSGIGVSGGQGELAMTTYTNEAHSPQVDNNFGGPKCALGSHYAAQLVADVDPTTGTYVMNRYIEASDGDNVWTQASGSGHAYYESLSSNMYAGQVNFNDFYCAFDAGTAGSGSFLLEGTGNNEVIKHGGFSTSGPTTWTAFDTIDAAGVHKFGTGAPSSAFLGIYAGWAPGTGFNISSYGMTAN